MNKIKLGTVAALMVLTTNAFADTSEGSYVGIGIGGYSGDVALSSGAASFTMGNDSLDFGATVYGGYKWNMGAGSVAAELSYNSNVGKLATWTVPGLAVSGKLTNNWAVSVLPGYNFTKDTTGYVRLGYTQAKAELTVNAATASHTFNGTVWGLGVDQAVSKNLSARLEYQVMDLSSWTDTTVTTYKPRSAGMNASVRYAF